MELDAIAACVIGGTSLRGGRGTVLGVLFGALIMASLLNGLTLMAVSPEIKYITRGVVLALAVWLDVRMTAARETLILQVKKPPPPLLLPPPPPPPQNGRPPPPGGPQFIPRPSRVGRQMFSHHVLQLALRVIGHLNHAAA